MNPSFCPDCTSTRLGPNGGKSTTTARWICHACRHTWSTAKPEPKPEAPACRRCSSLRVWKHGRTKNGTQKWMCGACRFEFLKCPEKPSKATYGPQVKARCIQMVREGWEPWRITGTIGIHKVTLYRWLRGVDVQCACGRRILHRGMCHEQWVEFTGGKAA